MAASKTTCFSRKTIRKNSIRIIESILGIAFLVIMLFCIQTTAKAEPQPIIKDDAELLTATEENALYKEMLPICKYGTPMLWTTNEDGGYKTLSRQFHENQCPDEKSWTLFTINMETRQISIFSDGDIYLYINSDVAMSITEKTYQMASQGKYYDCASRAFSEIVNTLSTQGRDPILFRNIEWGVPFPTVRDSFSNPLKFQNLVDEEFYSTRSVEYDLYDKKVYDFDERVSASYYKRSKDLSGAKTDFSGFKVAGYEVEEMQLKFAAIPDENGLILPDDEHTYFYFAKYVISAQTDNLDSAAKDLKKKLISLYGEPDDYFEQGTLFKFDKYTVWYGGKGTVLVLYIYEPQDLYGSDSVEKIEIRYGTLEGNTVLKKANEAAIFTREQNISTDVDGL